MLQSPATNSRKTKRQDTNNQATKSFKNYCQSLEPPMESQGLCNTSAFNLISNLLRFSTTVIISVALKEGEIFLWHLLWKHSKSITFLLATSSWHKIIIHWTRFTSRSLEIPINFSLTVPSGYYSGHWHCSCCSFPVSKLRLFWRLFED